MKEVIISLLLQYRWEIGGIFGFSMLVALGKCYFFRIHRYPFVHRADFKNKDISIEMLQKLPELFCDKFYSETLHDDDRLEFISDYYEELCQIDASILSKGFHSNSLEEYNLAHISARQFRHCLYRWGSYLIIIGTGLCWWYCYKEW